MRASLVIVGNELLSGHTEDANGPYLAGALHERGHRVTRITIVPDDEQEIVDALEESRERAWLLFVCGGLGPTLDDVTVDAVASFLDRDLEQPSEAKEQLRRIYRLGHEQGLLETDEVDEGAWRMARIPAGGRVVRNDAGAAPGSVHELAGGGRLFVLPGPPAELKSVLGHALEEGLVPGGEGRVTREVHLDTFEAPVSQELARLDEEHPDVRVGSYPQHGERRVVLRLEGKKGRVEAAVEDVESMLGEIVLEEGPGA